MRTARRPTSALLLSLLVATLSARAQIIRGTIESHSFTGPVSHRSVVFNVYLPPGYATATQQYPVVYHLHGLGGSQGGPQNTQVAASFEAATDACLIGPVIVVFPNGYTDNFWADSFDGLEPAETNVALDLVPYVDAHFRTIPDRSNRVVEGFSMGGMGTAKFFAKFPQLFSVGIEYDGALVTWADLLQSHPTIAQNVFGNSEAYFNLFSQWEWMRTNAVALRAGLNFRMVPGALVGGNRRFRDYLASLAIPFDYVETGCAHNLPCLLDSEGQASAQFIGSRLRPFVASATACRGGTAALSVDGAGVGPFTYQWRRNGAPIPAPAGLARTLIIPDATPAHAGAYDCTVTSACGTAVSNTATLAVCAADFNCDGHPDVQDCLTYLGAYAAAGPRADINGDGIINVQDFLRFLSDYAAGCPG
jgi:S-formylglutathione hydrolase FrmB